MLGKITNLGNSTSRITDRENDKADLTLLVSYKSSQMELFEFLGVKIFNEKNCDAEMLEIMHFIDVATFVVNKKNNTGYFSQTQQKIPNIEQLKEYLKLKFGIDSKHADKLINLCKHESNFRISFSPYTNSAKQIYSLLESFGKVIDHASVQEKINDGISSIKKSFYQTLESDIMKKIVTKMNELENDTKFGLLDENKQKELNSLFLKVCFLELEDAVIKKKFSSLEGLKNDVNYLLLHIEDQNKLIKLYNKPSTILNEILEKDEQIMKELDNLLEGIKTLEDFDKPEFQLMWNENIGQLTADKAIIMINKRRDITYSLQADIIYKKLEEDICNKNLNFDDLQLNSNYKLLDTIKKQQLSLLCIQMEKNIIEDQKIIMKNLDELINQLQKPEDENFENFMIPWMKNFVQLDSEVVKQQIEKRLEAKIQELKFNMLKDFINNYQFGSLEELEANTDFKALVDTNQQQNLRIIFNEPIMKIKSQPQHEYQQRELLLILQQLVDKTENLEGFSTSQFKSTWNRNLAQLTIYGLKYKAETKKDKKIKELEQKLIIKSITEAIDNMEMANIKLLEGRDDYQKLGQSDKNAILQRLQSIILTAPKNYKKLCQENLSKNKKELNDAFFQLHDKYLLMLGWKICIDILTECAKINKVDINNNQEEMSQLNQVIKDYIGLFDKQDREKIKILAKLIIKDSTLKLGDFINNPNYLQLTNYAKTEIINIINQHHVYKQTLAYLLQQYILHCEHPSLKFDSSEWFEMAKNLPEVYLEILYNALDFEFDSKKSDNQYNKLYKQYEKEHDSSVDITDKKSERTAINVGGNIQRRLTTSVAAQAKRFKTNLI